MIEVSFIVLYHIGVSANRIYYNPFRFISILIRYRRSWPPGKYVCMHVLPVPLTITVTGIFNRTNLEPTWVGFWRGLGMAPSHHMIKLSL